MSTPVKWRGGQVTRIEALTDAVFGFAITLLFVSFEVPASFDEMLKQLSGFVTFAACFALIILVWVYHYKLFSRFDMDDGWTIFLNSVLLFVVLFYVYPLKFTFTAWFGFMTGTQKPFSNYEFEIPLMMTIYAIGYIAVFFVFALMYLHAYRSRTRLNLSNDDVFYAISHVGGCLVMCFVGLISITLAWVTPWQISAMAAGMSYALIGPAQWWYANWIRRWWARRTEFA